MFLNPLYQDLVDLNNIYIYNATTISTETILTYRKYIIYGRMFSIKPKNEPALRLISDVYRYLVYILHPIAFI